MKNRTQILTLALLAITTIFVGCKKEFDTPPVKDIPVGDVLTVGEVKGLYVVGEEIEITKDYSVYGVITADETTGNLYKEAYLQDHTGGMYMRFTASSGVYIGDSVRINLNGATILKYNQMFQVDGLDPDNNVVKIATGQYRTPEVATIFDLFANDSLYQGRLVQLNAVEFICDDVNKTWADAINQGSEDRTLQDTTSNTIIVRSSGYANFAGDMLPTGKGNLIAIVSQYNSTIQLIIRDPNELTMYGTRKEKCADILKDFGDQSVTSGGWTTQNETGSINWTTSDQGSTGNFYGLITNTSSQLVGETWLISPALDLSSSSSPNVEFRSATFSSNPDLEFYVSTNYDGVSLPSTASWTLLSATYSSGSWNWTGSGSIDLSSYTQNGVYVAFKYNGTGSSWTTWEIDDIKIFK